MLRDEEGDVIYALGREVPPATNNEAEALAILEVLRYCVDHRFTQFWLQTDSMIMKNVLNGTWIPPWNVTEYVEEITNLIEGCNVIISHILWEGNSLADQQANYALDNGDVEAHRFT